MNELTDKNFGLLIAYLLPGLIAVGALSDRFPVLGQWLGASPSDSPTIGGFLYATIASVGAGLVVSAVRWLIVDTIHHRTGVPEPEWNFRALQQNYSAFIGAVTNHYRYYQAYANCLVALLVWLLARSHGWPPAFQFGQAALAVLLFVASRDALKKYYARSNAILYPDNSQRGAKSHDERLASRRAETVHKQSVEWGESRPWFGRRGDRKAGQKRG